ncbi:hypothetical protein C7999DRAFT_37891 [Corynascus novoguineensis]|uniref:ABM domain-containing protein n=1 Tax=Corynascus novoguineensis TaxID=1126955 RepID=A0AAN7D126_9PEZI|nr:hypothetical protein C7999DRAFT_37891 [Corynascus novoguineensis]
MPVTEFALLHLTTTFPPLPDPVRTSLAAATRLQDSWHATAFPSLPSSAAARALVWFSQVEDPSWLMTTAKWDSVTAHWDWIRSEENQAVMGQLGEAKSIISQDTVLFHVGGEIFSGASNAALLESPVISVERMFIPRANRGSFEAKFLEVNGILEDYAGPDLVRFGWREDIDESLEEEEFVLVCGWESIERHLAFVESQGYARYGEIRNLLARVDVKHYKRFSLE